MKKQINPTIKAHLIRSAFYVILLLAVCVIPFALAQRNVIKRNATKHSSSRSAATATSSRPISNRPSSIRKPGEPVAQPRAKATGNQISHAPRSGISRQPRKVAMHPSGAGCNYNFTTGSDTIVPGDTDTGNHADDGDTLVALPFSFQLYDQTYNGVNVNSNGRLDFVCINEPVGFLSACLPAPPNQCPYDFTIFPNWSDYRTDIVGEGCANFASGCGVFTSVSGSAPNRIFNIEWRAVYFADHNQTANFEVRLYENDPDKRFDVIFGDVQPGSDELFVSGVQGAAGAFTQDFCDFNPPAVGSRSYTCPGGPPPICGLLVGSGMTTGFLPNGWEPTLATNTVNYTFSNSQTAPNEFALFETHDPWGFTVIKDAITGAGHTYTEFTPANLAGFDFSQYSVVILNWDDTNAPDFLADYTAAIPALETYINAGGVVWITAAIQTCDSIPMPFGGTGTGCDFGSNDPVVDPASPMMVGMPNPIPGSAANHLSFTGLPAAAHIVVITDTTANPALYDFRPGENCGPTPTPSPTPGCQFNVLIVSSDLDVNPVMLHDQIAAEPDVVTVDYFDALLGTPALADLKPYNIVVCFSNSAFADPVGMGDVLADYADTGGTVVAFNFDWFGPPFGLDGRWMTGGYSPFNIGPTNFSDSCLGDYDTTHPLMQGIDPGSLCAFFRHTLTLAPGAVSVAQYQDGEQLCAYQTNNGHTGVGINAYVGDSAGMWSGLFGRVVVNAGRWVGNCQGGGPCTLQPWQIVANYPLIIESPAVCSAGTFAYVAGGRDSNTFLATDAFNQYDPVANTWTPLASLSQPIRDARAVYATNTNSIYVFGGIDINELVTNVVQKYDLGTGTWSTVTPMPAERFFPATVYYDATGLIYVAGGIDGSFLETDTTWIYDPVADTWDTSTAPNIPVVMGGSAVSLVGQNMYLQGSFGAGATNFNYAYDIVANSWTQKADMPAAVYEAAGASIGTNTYVVGGGDPALAPGSSKANRRASKGPRGSMARPDTSFNTTYVYDTVADSWTTGPNTNIAHSFTGGAAIGNKLIVVCGFDGVTGDTNTVETSDCGQGPPPPTPTPTPTPSPTVCPPTITESSSQEIVSGNSVACNNGIGTTENHYWRAFNMATFTGGQDYNVTSVSFGIELAQSGGGTGQPLTVNLYANHGSPFPLGDWQSNLIASSGSINIPDLSLTIFSVPLTVTVPGSALELVMEVMTPDGTQVGNLFFVGSNPDPESGLSYLSANDCGVPNPTPTGDLGFPNMHIVFNVNGSCAGGVSPTPTPTPVTPTPTPTPTPVTPTPTPTPTPSATRPPPTPRPRPTPFPRPTP